jgi:hypothetical protein
MLHGSKKLLKHISTAENPKLQLANATPKEKLPKLISGA